MTRRWAWCTRQAVKFVLRLAMLCVLFSAAGGMDFSPLLHAVPPGKAPWLSSGH